MSNREKIKDQISALRDLAYSLELLLADVEVDKNIELDDVRKSSLNPDPFQGFNYPIDTSNRFCLRCGSGMCRGMCTIGGVRWYF